jgi:hypothetical protein
MGDRALIVPDLVSENGTYVNRALAQTGERILARGDTVRVEDQVIRVAEQDRVPA